MIRQMTAIIEREGESYVALCPELDIASQGASVSEARANLKEALELFYETASANEIQRRLHDEIYVTHDQKSADAHGREPISTPVHQHKKITRRNE